MTTATAAVGGLEAGGVGYRRRLPVTIVLCGLFVLAIVVLAIIGDLIVGTGASATNLNAVGRPPSAEHWFGTDDLGRDVFDRIIAGSRAALIGPLVVAFSGLVFSSLLGILAGYRGGLIDTVIMRVVDFMFALPGLLIVIVVVAVTSGGYWTAIVVLSIFNVQGDIRIVRGMALEQRNLPYIEAARTVGVPPRRLMFNHVLPNIAPILVADFAIDFAGALVALSGLAYLGLGSQLGTAEWGRMLTDAQSLLFTNAMAALAPAGAIVLLAVSVNLIGDWLFDRYRARSGRDG